MYLGWAYSFVGRLDEDCPMRDRHPARPQFGNPYNDIGVYLMQQQRFDDAIPWLEQAKSATRYEPRHFPFINLGRIHPDQRDDSKSVEEFGGALKIIPDDSELTQLVGRSQTKLQ